MASPRTREIDGEPDVPEWGPHESGTRRLLRETVPFEARSAESPESVDPWASEAPQSLLSVASWLVHSVRGVPESRPPVDAPSITIADADLSVDELAAIDAEWTASQPQLVDDSVSVEVEQAVLSSDEAEAIDDFDLAPLRLSFERGDHLGLLVAAEALLEARPTMSAALPYLAAARESLRRRYMAELGGQREIPQLVVPRNDGVPPRLGPDEALMLGLVDGQSTLEEIVDRSQLPQVRALQLVDRLCTLGLLACGARHASYC